MWKKIFILIVAVLGINSLSAQKPAKKIEIKGTVLDVYNSPIANAIIMIDDQKTSSVTNSKGAYKIKVRSDASKISVFTFGNGTFEANIEGRTRIDFNAKSIAPAINATQINWAGEQGVNTGYSMVRKKNLTTEISKIDGTNKKYATYNSIQDMIEREVAGVRVDGSEVVIQDSQNLFGTIHPLIVVDGVDMTELPDIPPISVKSIEVLKASAAAIFGSRAYGGVIIIKTKLEND